MITEKQWNRFVWDLFEIREDFGDVYVMNRKVHDVTPVDNTFRTVDPDKKEYQTFTFQDSVENVYNPRILYANTIVHRAPLDTILKTRKFNND